MPASMMPRLLPLLLLLAACRAEPEPTGGVDAGTPWAETVAAARGQTVDLAMWNGDPFINAYMQDFVAPALRDSFGITLRVIGGQGSELVAKLMAEAEAGQADSGYDLMWINGETFFQLRQIDALYGPFLERLPNARFVDVANPFIGTDFQQPIDGYEAPWGNVQMAIIYDTVRVPRPWQTRDELAAWVQAHPGRFTWDNAFTGMTFLKALLIDIAGGDAALAGPFDQAKYDRYAPQLWAYVNRLKPYLWKRGETFPQGVAQLHGLFASGEVDFTMSNNDAEVDNKVLQGLFQESARAYVPAFGTIQNSHYLGIPKRAEDKAAALVAINFLMSPAAQLRKLDPQVWGDGTVLSMDKLPELWRTRFETLPGRLRAPRRADIQARAHLELAPEYMLRLYEDFRTQVIER